MERNKEVTPNPILVLMAMFTGLGGAAGGLICMWTVMALPSFVAFISSGLDVIGATQVEVLGKSLLSASPLMFLVAGFMIGGWVGVHSATLIVTAVKMAGDVLRPDWRWLRVERKRRGSHPRAEKDDAPKGGQPA